METERSVNCERVCVCVCVCVYERERELARIWVLVVA